MGRLNTGITPNVRQNLISSGYLHSGVENFLNVTNIYRVDKVYGNKLSGFEAEKNKLKSLLKAYQKIEVDALQDMLSTAGKTVRKTGSLDKREESLIRKFEEEFLLQGNFINRKGKISEEKIYQYILQKFQQNMNTAQFRTAITLNVKRQLFVTQKGKQTFNKAYGNLIDDAIGALINSNPTEFAFFILKIKSKKGKAVKPRYSHSMQNIGILLNELAKAGKLRPNSPEAVYLKQIMGKINSSNNLQQEMALISSKIKQEVKKEMPKVDPVFIDTLVDEVAKELEAELLQAQIQGFLSSESGSLGIQLEIFLAVTITNMFKKFNRKASSFLQAKRVGQSGGKTDLIIQTGRGKDSFEYNFQVKNHLDAGGFANVKFREGISFSKLKEEIDTLSLSSDKQSIKLSDLLFYLLVNMVFLNNVKNEDRYLSSLTKSALETNQILKKVLTVYMYGYVSGQTSSGKTLKTAKDITNNNLFVIYQGKLLIPISAFIKVSLNVLETSIQVLKTGQVSQTKSGLNIIKGFGMAAKPGLSASSATQSFATNLYNNKKQVIESLDNHKYEYPEPLTRVGQSGYESIFSTGKISRLGFLMKEDQLEQSILEVYH